MKRASLFHRYQCVINRRTHRHRLGFIVFLGRGTQSGWINFRCSLVARVGNAGTQAQLLKRVFNPAATADRKQWEVLITIFQPSVLLHIEAITQFLNFTYHLRLVTSLACNYSQYATKQCVEVLTSYTLGYGNEIENTIRQVLNDIERTLPGILKNIDLGTLQTLEKAPGGAINWATRLFGRDYKKQVEISKFDQNLLYRD